MEVKLKVLAGAKVGAEIPLKKDKFIIGRSRECSLRAGSDAISRRHCVLRVKNGEASVRDLGSRNGTYLNDKLVETETRLSSGDELRIGPLQFEVHIGQGINRSKRPQVEDVADAASRTVEAGEDAIEDDISRWLIDGGSPNIKETQTMSTEETGSVVLASGGEEETSAATASADDETGSADAADGPTKQTAGKLPAIPKKTAKSSGEAAAEVLRALSRRR